MTWGNPPKFIPVAPKQGKKLTPEMLAKSGSEDGHQMALFCWAADSVGMYPQLKWLFAIPNGGSRYIAEATKMVATGLRRGVPDVCLPYALNYMGCFIELKIEKRRNTKNGGCSDEQLEWMDYLKTAGYYCAVCYSWIEAKDVLIKYLKGKV
jgi:hypothetical protein